MLRRIFSILSMNGKRWWIASDPRDTIESGRILVGDGDPACVDRLNTALFSIPVLNDGLPRAGADSLVFLVDPSAISMIDSGYYFAHGRVVQDSVADLEAFFQPVKTAFLTLLGGHGDPEES
jgi:hypothetical protein